MENFNGINPGNQDFDQPIPFDDSDTGGMGVSHSPLDLGGSAVPLPKIGIPQPTAKPKVAAPQPAAQPVAVTSKIQKQQVKVNSTEDRIQGVKTFFTKLHAGAIDFLDCQITRWLEENPQVIIKRTNVVVGEIQAKKTEPNVIITVWY